MAMAASINPFDYPNFWAKVYVRVASHIQHNDEFQIYRGWFSPSFFDTIIGNNVVRLIYSRYLIAHFLLQLSDRVCPFVCQ